MSMEAVLADLGNVGDEHGDLLVLNNRMLQLVRRWHEFHSVGTITVRTEYERIRQSLLQAFESLSISDIEGEFGDKIAAFKKSLDVKIGEYTSLQGSFTTEERSRESYKSQSVVMISKVIELQNQLNNNRNSYRLTQCEVESLKLEIEFITTEIATLSQLVAQEDNLTKVEEERLRTLQQKIEAATQVYQAKLSKISISSETASTTPEQFQRLVEGAISRVREKFDRLDTRKKEMLQQWYKNRVPINQAITTGHTELVKRVEKLNSENIDFEGEYCHLGVNIKELQMNIESEKRRFESTRRFVDLNSAKIKQDNEAVWLKIQEYQRQHVALLREIARYRELLDGRESTSYSAGSETYSKQSTFYSNAPVKIADVDAKYVALQSISNADQQLDGWRIVRVVDNGVPITFKFPPFVLRAGATVKIYGYGQAGTDVVLPFFELVDHRSWGLPRRTATTTVQTAAGEDRAKLIETKSASTSS